MKKTIITTLFCALTLFVVSAQNNQNNTPTSIIFLIGDGMGISQISAGHYFGGENSIFNIFDKIGLIRTHSKTNKVTDSAAASTAFATGQKTYNRAIGVDTDSNKVANLVEILKTYNYSTGLISISSITHGTPAGFYAHVKDRDSQEDIALQLTKSGVDYFSGGGLKFFNQRADKIDLINELKVNNYQVDTIQDYNLKLAKNKKYGFLLAEDGLSMVAQERQGFLAKSLTQGLQYLKDKSSPFFVMAEGSYIDWAGHRKDAEMMLNEQLDFEKAVKVAVEYVDKNPNTLLIVTGDHETGGVSVQKGKTIQELTITFSGDQHTATMLPVFAYGPHAEKFTGVYENTDIFYRILNIVKANKK
jgi:alkaline phosphatase